MDNTSPRFLFAGKLTRDYLIFPSGEALIDVPGGSVLYAAVGLTVWEPEPPPGIIARVGEDYPQKWLDEYMRRGLDMRGVQILPHAIDVRSFKAFTDRTSISQDEPVTHFARLGLPFPKALLGYREAPEVVDSRTSLQTTSLRREDIRPTARATLTRLFGTSDWYSEIFTTNRWRGFFHMEEITRRQRGCEIIIKYFLNRLKTVFPHVARNPLKLRNSRGLPMYLLCFASPSKERMEIAQKLFKRVCPTGGPRLSPLVDCP